MSDRFTQFPQALAQRARSVRLGPTAIPALLAHPDWSAPAPTVIWMHGRTVSKELDPGRYLRWIRAGIAACSIDLPGHGERLERSFHTPARTLDVLEQVIPEIDQAAAALAAPEWNGVFDLTRLGLGGMSAGGMATLRRLCDPHPFVCACVEATAGDFDCLYNTPRDVRGGMWTPPRPHPSDRLARLDPAKHLDRWRPLPLLHLHAETDRVVPLPCATRFLESLRSAYAAQGADPSLVQLTTWRDTGAPEEHAGFGRFSNDAKNAQTEFLARHLRPAAPRPF